MVELARQLPAVADAVWLKTLPTMQRFAFYGDARARALVLPVWGVKFSEAACRAHTEADRATLWLGPDEYLLLDKAAGAASSSGTAATGGGARATGTIATLPGSGALTLRAPTLLETLEHALAEVPHSLVDIAHRQFALEVSGPHAATILYGACPLDLDLAEFPVGMCTRTVLAKADIVLWRTREDMFHLEVWRSFAGYVSGILREIATEFYPA